MRILADTSVWIAHLRHGQPGFERVLQEGEVLLHPFILGELALGVLPGRSELIADLRQLPQATLADDDEVLGLIEQHALFGRGICYLDAHLLAATRLTFDACLWTLDRRLDAAARQLGLAATVDH